MADKAKHAFGSSANIQSALAAGKIDEFDILFLDGDTDEPKVGWVDKNGEVVIVRSEDEVIVVDALPETGVVGSIYVFGEDAYIWNGEKFVNLCKPTDVSELKDQLAALESKDAEFAEKDVALEAKDAELEAKSVALEEKSAVIEAEVAEKIDAEEADAVFLSKKYEISGTPKGTLVNYGENEIRVMAPADADWHLQSVGTGGNPNAYYMTFNTYAPSDDAVGYIEHLGDLADDHVLTDLKTDKYGRKYQPTWLAMATYDSGSDTWSYNGAASTADHYIGWDYQIDWYNADGVMIATDSVRINLSNEDCHYSAEPYYISNMMQTIEERIDAKIEEISEIPVVEF